MYNTQANPNQPENKPVNEQQFACNHSQHWPTNNILFFFLALLSNLFFNRTCWLQSCCINNKITHIFTTHLKLTTQVGLYCLALSCCYLVDDKLSCVKGERVYVCFIVFGCVWREKDVKLFFSTYLRYANSILIWFLKM